MQYTDAVSLTGLFFVCAGLMVRTHTRKTTVQITMLAPLVPHTQKPARYLSLDSRIVSVP